MSESEIFKAMIDHEEPASGAELVGMNSMLALNLGRLRSDGHTPEARDMASVALTSFMSRTFSVQDQGVSV